jgi:hypothetical protein
LVIGWLYRFMAVSYDSALRPADLRPPCRIVLVGGALVSWRFRGFFEEIANPRLLAS